MEYLNYPEEKTEIFKPSEKNYFLKADKFSYLCTYGDIKKVDRYRDFTDSFVLVTYKRSAVIKGGAIIFANENFNDGNIAKGRYKENGFVIICDTPKSYFIQSWNKNLESYEIRDDSDYNKALNPVIYKTAENAVCEATRISGETDNTYIVAQWFDDFSRR